MTAETGRGLHEYGIAVTDQAAERITVYDPAKNDWNDDEAKLWSWAPSGTNGFAGLTRGWGLPSDVKLREGRTGGTYMVVTDSRGLAAIVPYPAGDRRTWGAIVGGNPHAAELLPDGNIAIAASEGGWVRVYTASLGPDSADFAEYALPGAHGVLWDPRLCLLWAVGDRDLAALRVNGTAEAPVLEEALRSKLPSDWGHDLFAVYGNPDKLWVTTNTRVYQYDKPGDSWSSSYEGASEIDERWVKSIGNQPSGRVVKTVQKPGTKYVWTTDTVDLHVPGDRRTVSGGAFYKARIWSTDYQ
ncbi:DUF6528 family protein [Paenibacillus flagellatus]|uniref:DUF6528 family protein n=1 Tax=Paenibacillus flagellatus TaxID=2211139 RepID=UPI0011B7E1BD|nr:DUF6528 family protein [Paenibacillus flagellatus]